MKYSVNCRESIADYIKNLSATFNDKVNQKIENLAIDLREAWKEDQRVYIIGNGGSAANAIHIANDLHYGIGACGEGKEICGLKVEALTANSAIISCLGNDLGYENIFVHQIKQKGESGDILIALSGSGNSQNIATAIEEANKLGMKTHAILGYDGGKCIQIAGNPIHFEVNDMQIAEDTQLIVGHICMQWLSKNKLDK